MGINDIKINRLWYHDPVKGMVWTMAAVVDDTTTPPSIVRASVWAGEVNGVKGSMTPDEVEKELRLKIGQLIRDHIFSKS